MKKKILFVYPSMILGGSTTALLSLMNCLDSDKYEIDLQLFRNEGPLLDAIPQHVNLLPEAEIYKGRKGRVVKLCKFLLSGYDFRYLHKGRTVLCEFQSKHLSHKNHKEYDYAIGFLEGWSDWYLTFGTLAKKKYAWLHSTYANITPDPTSELPWMERVDKIAFVTDACREAFDRTLPQMAEKSITVENITDSEIIRKRSLQVDKTDEAYEKFEKTNLFKIITVCRLTIQVKGLDRIVNAAKELKNKGYRFLWYIIGDGEDQAALQALIGAANVGDCVVPIGKRMNPYPFIAAADIMCMPSRYEGKPVTVTEAMILGTPPVVTEYLSARDQIAHGIEGIVAPNEDDAIIDVVENCVQDPVLVQRMQKNLSVREYGNANYISTIEKTLLI